MNKRRKHYEAAFKLEIARMVVDLGLSITQVVKEMSNWVNPVSGSLSLPSSNAYANWRPRTELRSDNELLKKALAFFARELR